MTPAMIGVLCMLCLFAMALAGVHVAATMAIIAFVLGMLMFGAPSILNVANLAWATTNEFLLVSVPMFILMGEILLRSGMADRIYASLSVWMNRIPGGLLHTNVAACALFSATSGSSVATAATVGTVAMPNIINRGYNQKLALGSIAAGGTLGILIPPSINMIIYAALTNTSVGRLFAAGIVPGLLMAALFMVAIGIWAVLQPEAGGRVDPPVPLLRRLRLLVDLIPLVVIFVIVMGSIYTGWATATEAAALGTVTALALAWFRGKLSLSMLNEAFISTIRITGMVTIIIVAAFFLNFMLSLAGIPQAMAAWVNSMGTSPWVTLAVLVVIYLILGCFLETMSMLITTMPIVAPIAIAQGMDPVWFGIFIIIMCELSLITPPVGMNLYVVQGIRPPGSNIMDVILGVLPFIACMLAMIVVIAVFPQIVLWVPDMLYN